MTKSRKQIEWEARIDDWKASGLNQRMGTSVYCNISQVENSSFFGNTNQGFKYAF